MAHPAAAEPLTHGFLFADLRGYTSFADARGDTAAADLLDRYRLHVRAVVADLGGAEVKTEGDSFYLVFPSASRAIAAGLAIVERAAEASATRPDSPIRVGVGIHAGEAEARAEGYVGSAVNIAARVCAQSKAGEVLVTETVRALSRTSGRYRFTPRGRPSLKGIAEPIALFRVETASSDQAAPARYRRTSTWLTRLHLTRTRNVLIGGLILGIVALALGSRAIQQPAASVGATSGASGPASVVPSASTGPTAFVGGPLGDATYQTGTFTPVIRLTTPAGSWNMVRELPNELDLSPTGDTTAHLLVFRPTIGFVPCSNTATLPLGNRAEDVIAFLAHDRAVTLGPPVATRLGDADTTMVNVTLGSGCGAMPEQRLFLIWSISGATLESNGDDVTLPIISGHRTELFVTEVVGQAFVIALDSRAGSFDAFAVAARSLLSTLEFVR